MPHPLGVVHPGAPKHPPILVTALRKAWDGRPEGYQPRTHHLQADGTPKFTNRLFLESSPYLIQHAHNPVNWFPWGEEAFDTARSTGKPVLLSIGYSTCHWCHVMEEESFEDEEIAGFMNTHYLPVKVDREERPDVDAVYMSAIQMLNRGSGGWPMTVWLTPERKPFFGGTYYPARDGNRGTPMGFLSVLGRLRHAYDHDGERVAQSAQSLADAVKKQLEQTPQAELSGEAALRESFAFYQARYDPVHGGVGHSPKFPSSLPVRHLFRHAERTGQAEPRQMAEHTLQEMSRGGMYDHLAGGFHRYSVDEKWLVPHFEKMLYDNALLVSALVEGVQITGRSDFENTAREVLDYVTREMTDPQGAFYSATDADSIGPEGKREEGYFFTWTPEELEHLLGTERAQRFGDVYGVTPVGNFEGRSILHLRDQIPSKDKEALRQDKAALYQARCQRPLPLRDDKILTAWNGLMISAFAKAGFTFDEPSYLKAAEKAATYLWDETIRHGVLRRSHGQSESPIAGFLEDYAFFIAGLLDLYESTHRVEWLRHARKLDAVLAESFEDAEQGGYFTTSTQHESLLAREKPNSDGAEPSGNSVQALNLLRLAQLTGQDNYRVRAEATLGAFGAFLNQAPGMLSEMMLALDFHLSETKQVVVIAPSIAQAQHFLKDIRRSFSPNSVLVVAAEADALSLASEIPLLKGRGCVDGKPTAYVCVNQTCSLPSTETIEI